jgi:hypothetical protein
MPNLSISFVQVYAEDRKKLEVKKFFLKFLCGEPKNWLSAKKIFAKCFFFAESFVFGSLDKEASVPSIFCLPGVFYLSLGKAFFVKSFLFSSRQRNEL